MHLGGGSSCLVETPEDLGKHRGIKRDTRTQHVKGSEVNNGVGSDDCKRGFPHTYEHLRHDNVGHAQH